MYCPHGHTERERVTWCFTPNKPVRLYQGERETDRETDTERQRHTERHREAYTERQKECVLKL